MFRLASLMVAKLELVRNNDLDQKTRNLQSTRSLGNEIPGGHLNEAFKTYARICDRQYRA